LRGSGAIHDLDRPAGFAGTLFTLYPRLIQRPSADPAAPVRVVIWIYFWLLLCEGVLRKWVWPSQSDLLFVIRDPVAILAYVLALRAGVFPIRPAVIVLGVMMLLSVLFTLTTDTPPLVLLFGLRTDFLHLPLVFVIAAVMDRNDVTRMGRWFMIASIPIVILMVRQFDADPGDPINVGAGGFSGGQLRGAMGKIRPPGPFSFITGPVSYFSIVAAYVCHGWSEARSYPRLWLWLGTCAVIAVVPVSISRSLLLGVLIVIAFAGVVTLRNPRTVPRFIGPVVVAGSFLAFAADTVYVQAFLTRWDEASSAGNAGFYNNSVARLIGTFTQPFMIASDTPLLGHGVGMGTVAGSRLMTGKFMFVLSESELMRNILELGPVLGFAFIAWRAWLAITLVARGWRAAREEGDVLPWMLAGATFLNVLTGQWGQATQLGFAVLGAGLTLAALNRPAADDWSEETDTAPEG